MIVLGIDRGPARAYGVLDFLALLVSLHKILDQLNYARVSGSRITPSSSRSRRLAVDLIGYGTMDHVQVLLSQGDISLPSQEQLCLGRCHYHDPRRQADQTL